MPRYTVHGSGGTRASLSRWPRRKEGAFMPTTVRTHPWWVAGLAALAAAATLGVLALAGAFDTTDAPSSTAPAPAVVVAPSSGGIDHANAARQERQLQHGVVPAAAAAVAVSTGDTKDDVTAKTDGPTYEGLSGDTKGDLPASKPASELGHGAAGYRSSEASDGGH